MKRQLMAEQWDQFSRSVLPRDAPQVQRTEMRRAFYAGAQSILFRVIQALTPESEPTDKDVDLLQDVHDELKEFAKLVEQGRA